MTEVQYITDANGHRTGVILPIEEYEDLVGASETPEEEAEVDEKFCRILESSDTAARVSFDDVLTALRKD